MKLQTLALVAAAALSVATSPVSAAPVYDIIGLGDLPGGSDSSEAYGINDTGQVVGRGQASTGTRAFLWDAVNGLQDLGDLPGGIDSSQAFAINGVGQVVGSSRAATGERAFLWDSTSGLQDLGDLPGGGDFSSAYDINDVGQVVGQSSGASGGQAFVWDSVNGLEAILTYTSSSVANGINDSGQIVGWRRVNAGSLARPEYADYGFLWDSDTGIVNLRPRRGDDSRAYGVNAAGLVVGRDVGEDFRGFTRITASAWNLDGTRNSEVGASSGSATSRELYDINDAGEVVGLGIGAGGFGGAIIWTAEDGTQDLNELIDPSSNWRLSVARAINASGQIVGRGIGPNGYHEAFLLTPRAATSVPEPGSLTILCVGLLGLGIARRRRLSALSKETQA